MSVSTNNYSRFLLVYGQVKGMKLGKICVSSVLVVFICLCSL